MSPLSFSAAGFAPVVTVCTMAVVLLRATDVGRMSPLESCCTCLEIYLSMSAVPATAAVVQRLSAAHASQSACQYGVIFVPLVVATPAGI